MLTHRSYKSELLDGEDVPFCDIEQNMRELDFINKFLGGHKITIQAISALAYKKSDITVCEIGCGGGDNLLAIDYWCRQHNIKVNLIGIDIKPACITYAKAKTGFVGNVSWIISDYAQVAFEEKPDIIFSSLFCHHFTNAALINQLKWMKANSISGFFINDLHRHIVAYYSIKLITQLFSQSYLVKNDAPLSVARAFKKAEWRQLCQQAGIINYTITWKFAFRYLIIHKN